MVVLNSKLPNVGTTIFTIMSKMAAQYEAINLSQGFPDFPVSKELITLIEEAMAAGQNQYAPMAGLPELRLAISKMIARQYDHSPNPETEITITSGATEGLFASIMALVQPGDEVIVFDPAYDSYSPAITLAGGTPVHIDLKYPSYTIDWNQVADSITSRTRLIIINSPHNPTGTILSSTDFEALQDLVEKHNLIVISDEVYEHIIFDQNNHQSILRYPALKNRCIAISSFGKTFHATGWKVGYVIASEDLTNEIRKVHQYLTFSVHTPSQVGISTFLQEPSNYLELAKMYESKRDFFLRAIQSSRFKPLQSSGTYFQLLNYGAISDERDTEMATRITKEFGVASIPVSVFYHDQTDNKVLRFCFAKEESTLAKAAEILCRI